MENDSSEEVLEGGSEPISQMPQDDHWLQMSRQGWEQGETWFEDSLRPRIERNLAHYKSRHEAGSKYHTEAFKKRSRMFRPLTRKAVRRFAAACGRAFFSTMDIVACEPVNHSDEDNVLAAKIQQALLNYRLTNSLPWWTTVIAAASEVGINGVCISKEVWEYEVEAVERTVNQGGKWETVMEEKVVRDRPMTRLVPLENIRISPASDWVEPIKSTPFIIEKVPYFLGDLRERMRRSRLVPYRKGLTDAELLQGDGEDFNSLRARREDSTDRYSGVWGGEESSLDVVWVRECIVRMGDIDIYYETVGDSILLSEPVPLRRVHRAGRPYTMGRIDAEPHVLYMDGIGDLGAGLQREANEIVNSRLDNVKLSMTGRWIVARGKQTDIRSLMRNVPGSVTYSQSPNDVRAERPADVTGSAYQEQDRINLDMDDILGSFSQASVQGNRALNETVGGMQMLNDGASDMTEFMVRCFAESWYQETLQLKADLCRHHESDEAIMTAVGEPFGADARRVFRLLGEESKVTVNVSFGMTNPTKRVERMSMAIGAVTQFFPEMAGRMDSSEVIKEVFGAMGYRDGARFFPHIGGEEDPMVTELQQQVAQLKQMLESQQAEAEAKERSKLEIETIRAQSRERIERIKAQVKMSTEALKAEIKNIELEIQQTDSEIEKRQLYMQREALSHTIDNENRRLKMEEERFRREIGDVPDVDGDTSSLVADLRDPSSGKPIPSGGEDRAGVISRGEYGAIPGKRDFMEG